VPQCFLAGREVERKVGMDSFGVVVEVQMADCRLQQIAADCRQTRRVHVYGTLRETHLIRRDCLSARTDVRNTRGEQLTNKR